MDDDDDAFRLKIIIQQSTTPMMPIAHDRFEIEILLLKMSNASCFVRIAIGAVFFGQID